MKGISSLVILLAMVPGLANALGLGNLELNSSLNEPFKGKIKLISATADELDSLNIQLASVDAFNRANIDRPLILRRLNFKLIRSETGADYIKVSSDIPIGEPFLNFLLEVSWPEGRLFREYKVLFDPVTYSSNLLADEIMGLQPPPIPTTTPEKADSDNQVVYSGAFDEYYRDAASSPVDTTSTNYNDGYYGPTKASDTLWSVASKARPDNSVSVNQMMMALLNANPEAFFNNNINSLKRGQILKIPSLAEVNALTNSEALAQVKSQHAAWEQLKNKLSASVTERPEGGSLPTSNVDETKTGETKTGETKTGKTKATTATVDDTSEAELRLVAADDGNESTQEVAGVEGNVAAELALAQENIQALTQESMELRERINENESIITDLRRLLELKDNELATIQERLPAKGAETIKKEVVAEDGVIDIADEIEADGQAEDQEETAREGVETAAVTEVSQGTIVVGILAAVVDMLANNHLYVFAIVGLIATLTMVIAVMRLKKKSTVKIDIAAGEPEEPQESAGIDDLFQVKQPSDTDGATDSNEVAEPSKEPASAIKEEEEEQLHEADTYIAFEQFDQAEEIMRKIINDEPDNPEYHTKLLEVFYSAGNKKSYEEEAKVLHDIVGSENEHWGMAVAMWSEMSPNRALFEKGDVEEETEAADTGGDFVDLVADDQEAAKEKGVDLDVTADDESEDKLENTLPVKFDEDLLRLAAAKDEGSAYGNGDMIDSNLGFSEESDGIDGIDFTMDLGQEASEEGPNEEEFADFNLEEDIVEEDIVTDDDSTVFVASTAKDGERSAKDGIAAKLDLAKAYIEVGDKDNAQIILDKIMEGKCDDDQKQQTQELLGQI